MLHLFTRERDELHEVWFKGGPLRCVENEQRQGNWNGIREMDGTFAGFYNVI